VTPVTEDFEIVLVDDGSPDRSWRQIVECCNEDSRVIGLKLSRNFGQHSAITAALAHTRGDWIVVMDCDLQDNPRYIPQLYETALRGFDIVYTVKEERKHGFVKNLLAHMFFRCANWLSSGDKADSRIGTYSLLSRRAVDSFLQLQDVHRHYLMLVRWLGFPSTRIRIRHEPRFAGRTSYSLPALVRHAVNGMVSHSDRLLYVSVGIGFAFLTLSLLGAAYLVSAFFLTGFREGWTSTIVTILLCTSMILLSIGTTGIYIGKIFEQVKRRPLYLVEEVRFASVPPTRDRGEEERGG
jgi:dolichol-phosphate mannosyltransferase